MAAPSTALNRIGETNPAAVVNWDQELNGARMLLKSGLLPASIKTPETALFIILAGRDLGLSPVQSLRSIHVIQGKVEVAADMQLGLFHRAGGKTRWIELTNDRAVLELHAPWLVKAHVETFTREDAVRAKLGGDNYAKYPKAMYRSRAITAGLKSVGFDPTAGVYDYGELGGTEPVVVEDVPTVEPDEAEPIAGDEVVEDAKERQALADLEELMPALAVNQREWVREKLADGGDPIALLSAVRIKASNAEHGK